MGGNRFERIAAVEPTSNATHKSPSERATPHPGPLPLSRLRRFGAARKGRGRTVVWFLSMRRAWIFEPCAFLRALPALISFGFTVPRRTHLHLSRAFQTPTFMFSIRA